MKKLFIFLFLLVQGLVFSKGEGGVEGKVNITAKIIKPLEMNVIDHLDFGLITPGQQKKYPEVYGSFEVSGTPGENIKVFVKTNNSSEYSELGTPLPVHDVVMSTGAGSSQNEKMIAKIGIMPEGGGSSAGNIVLDKGKKLFAVGGYVSAASDQKEGNYKGDITIKALYE